MCAKIIYLLCAALVSKVDSATTYDQRQTGDLNVQVDLKDLRIIALMKGGKEEYVDYDYAYDYSEMTIKPQNGTTPKPLNVTSDSPIDNTSTEQATIKANHSQSLETTEVTWYQAINESTTTVKTLEPVTTEATDFSIKTSTTPVSSCKKGFVMNNKGDCEIKIQSTGNALLKLVKLSQKLKLRRENRRDQDTSS